MKLYAQLDQNDETILNISTKSVEDIMTEVVLDDETLDVSKLPGYKINPVETVYHITFDQEKYDTYLETQKQQEAVEEGKDLLKELTKQITANTILNSATDEQAYVMRYLYPEYDPNGHVYKKDDRFIHNDKFYKVLQDHTSQVDWAPESASSLYVEISDPNIEWPDFKQPNGAHDAYMKDDKVTYNGKHYISLIDNNTWSPDDYQQGWELVE